MEDKNSQYSPLKQGDTEPGLDGESHRQQRRPRRSKVAVILALVLVKLTVVLYYVHRRQRQSFGAQLFPGHGGNHGRKWLNGKPAEKLFLTVPKEEGAHAALKLFASTPHIAGATDDFKTALDFLKILQTELGIVPPAEQPIFPAGSPQSRQATLGLAHAAIPKAWIDIYYPVLNLPKERHLEALDSKGKVVWTADLKENADPADPDAGKYSDTIPAFHGLSAAGDVTGKLVDVNYGTIEDYEQLAAKGVNLTGTIVIARYGRNFRGLKIKAAQEAGAAGVLIYSDPGDDGGVSVDNGFTAYPFGPARNLDSVQRGSVQYLSLYPGDPSTPGLPAYENSTRTVGDNIPKIPSLPISWNNAKKLLKGKLDFEKVRLANDVDTKVTPIWNVLGVIPGYITDEVVVVGNHRDAWVLGAADPSSGTAALHETIRGLGELLRKGWKPLRTILIASWDAEEYGLVGSTEWGEDFPEWIDANVVAYLNIDVGASGSSFGAGASPLLAHLVRDSALEIPHPTDVERTLWDARNDLGPFRNTSKGEHCHHQNSVATAEDVGVGPLGSGSDFTVFLQRLGVASMSHGFGNTQFDAPYHYHSVYDTVRWMELYGDPGFFRHAAIAKHLGLITLRLADSVVLPLNTTYYSLELENYLNKVQDLVSVNEVKVDLDPLRKSIRSLQAASRSLDYEKFKAEEKFKKIVEKILKKHRKWRRVQRKARKIYCRIQKKLGHPCQKHYHEDERHELAELLESKSRHMFGRLSAMLFPAEGTHTCGTWQSQLPWKFPLAELRKAIRHLRAVNKKLILFERGFISELGIPDREWYRHLGVAPGKWLGYGATTFPALTESITIEKNADLAKHEAERLELLIDAIADKIRLHA